MAVTPQLGKTYNFKTLSPVILGSEYKNQKVIGIFNSTEAMKYGDIQTTYALVSKQISTLPKINDLTFILFESLDQDKTILALEYLDVNTIVEVTTFNLNIVVNNASTEDTSIITNMLKELGYTNFTIDKI